MLCQTCWDIFVIPAFESLGQELKDCLGYTVGPKLRKKSGGVHFRCQCWLSVHKALDSLRLPREAGVHNTLHLDGEQED